MTHRIVNPWSWQDAFGFVQAHEVSHGTRVVFCAGQTSVDENGGPLHPGDMAAQANQALDNLERVLADADLTLADVVRLNYFTTDVEAFIASAEHALPRLRAAGCRPASTLLGVQRLAFPELLVEIEATAVAVESVSAVEACARRPGARQLLRRRTLRVDAYPSCEAN
jgi:enamine deaminase RidA (YjgF/YER057c/UK114 family)